MEKLPTQLSAFSFLFINSSFLQGLPKSGQSCAAVKHSQKALMYKCFLMCPFPLTTLFIKNKQSLVSGTCYQLISFVSSCQPINRLRKMNLTLYSTVIQDIQIHSTPCPPLPFQRIQHFLKQTCWRFFFFFPQGLPPSQRFRRDGNNNQHLAFMNPQRAISVTHEMYNNLWAGLRVVFVEVTSLLHQCRATSISILPGSAILILKISIVFLTSVELFLLTAAELLASSF